MTRGGWKAPSNIANTGSRQLETVCQNGLSSKSSSKQLPAVLDGMDKAEALAYVSRLFDAAQAGAVLWGDALLIKRFIGQCSRTGSKATQEGYRDLKPLVAHGIEAPLGHADVMDPTESDELTS